MTAPIEEEEIVGPLRLQPVVARGEGWRGRSSSLVAAGLVAFIVIGIVLGAAFNDGGPASSPVAIASRVPADALPSSSRRPTPTRTPLAPPLPDRLVVGGRIPTEQRLVNANGLQVLDLTTGRLTSPSRSYEDFVLPLGDDQLVCACIVRRPPVGDATSPALVVQFARLDLTGAPIVDRDVVSMSDVVPVPDMTEGYTLVAALSADQRDLFILAALRRPPLWEIELLQVAVATGELVGKTVLESLPVDVETPAPSASARPAGSPPDGVYVWASMLAASPHDGTLFASINLSEVRNENWTSSYHEWLVPLDESRPDAPIPLAPDSRLKPDTWCLGSPAFIDPKLIVQVCTSPEASRIDGGGYVLRRLTIDGANVGDLPIPGHDTGGRIPIATTVDRARRALLVWDPTRHILARLGIDDGHVETNAVAESMLPGDPPAQDRGYFGTEPGLVLAPDGERIYALGIGRGPSQAGQSTGVWVFDATELGLLDHWGPQALLISLAVSNDGQFVYASGASGFDVNGAENPAWQASVTVYDAATGEVQLIYGAIERDIWISFRSLS